MTMTRATIFELVPPYRNIERVLCDGCLPAYMAHVARLHLSVDYMAVESGECFECAHG